MTPEPPVNPKPRRRRWRRRIVIGTILVLAILPVVAVEIVLRTDLPRRMVVEELEAATGLRVEIGSLDTGWSGRSTIHDLVLRLPLDDAPIAAAPLVQARHATLLTLLLTRDPDITEVSVERPELSMTEDAAGEWTLIKAVDLIDEANQNAPDGPTVLPKIDAIGGSFRLRRAGRDALVLPLELHAVPQGSLTSQVDLALGGASIVGRVSTSTWDHDVEIKTTGKAGGIEPVLAQWIADLPAPLTLDAHWEGRPDDAGISGDIQLRAGRAGEHTASGRLAISADEHGVSVHSAVLAIRSPLVPAENLDVHEAQLRVSDAGVSCERLSVTLAHTDVDLHGTWEDESATARLIADWSQDALAPLLHHTGRVELEARLPPVGELSVSGQVQTSGGIRSNVWATHASVTAEGPDWERLRAEITAPGVSLGVEGEPIELAGLHAAVAMEWPVVRLSSLTLSNLSIARALAEFNVSTSAWSVQLDADGFKDSRVWAAPLAVNVNASGDTRRADVQALTVMTEAGSISATGSYDEDRENPVQGHVRADVHLPPELLAPNAAAHTGGSLVVDANVEGTLRPLLIQAAGSVVLPKLVVESGTVGPFDMAVEATASAQAVTLHSAPVDILGGRASVEATYIVSPESVDARVNAAGVPIEQIVGLFAPGVLVDGTLDADFGVKLPGVDLDRAEADGSWTVHETGRGEWRIPRGQGRFAAGASGLRLHDLTLENGDARATGSVELNGGVAQIDMAATRWPVAEAESGVSAFVDGTVDLDLDLSARSATGDARLHADARLADGTPAVIDAALVAEGRTLHASTLQIDMLGGRLSGSATFPIDDWQKAAAACTLEQLDLAQVGAIIDPDMALKGRAGGTIELGPATDPRALEPVRLAASIDIAGGSVHDIELGKINLIAYAGDDRVILDQSDVVIAGGTVSAWSRLTWHENEPFLHVNLDAKGMDLHQFVHAIDPTLAPTPGRVGLQSSIAGYIHSPHRAFGEARLKITHAELQPIPGFAMLYSVLHVELGDKEPQGEGEVLMRLEGDALRIARLQYYHRGTDINGAGSIDNIWLAERSPIRGGLVATLRPLRGSGLPFGPELDHLLGGVLSNAASVKLGGTLEAPTREVVPLADVVSFFQGVFGAIRRD